MAPELESVACPLCGTNESKVLVIARPNLPISDARFRIVRCQACGLGYSSPRVTDRGLSTAYEACYSLHEQGEPPLAASAGAFRRWWRHVTQRQIVADWVENGPVLDVGCATGDLLQRLRERGLEVEGIEPDPASVEVCQRRGLRVACGSVEEIDLPASSFGTILMSHVLEHVQDPLTVLGRLRAALAPGGRLVVAVPNYRSLTARAFGPTWHGWDPPFHLTHFSPDTLRAMLGRAGFRVKHVLTRGNPEDVTRSLSKMLDRPVNALWARLLLLPPSVASGALHLGGEICAVAER